MSKVRAELLRFLIVGLTTVLIDWVVYQLTMVAGMSIGLAKATGFLGGTIFSFFANRQWTFALSGKGHLQEVGRFIAVYGTSLVANVGVNSGMLVLVGRDQLALAGAFVIATGVSATLNFFGMKFLVFISRDLD